LREQLAFLHGRDGPQFSQLPKRISVAAIEIGKWEDLDFDFTAD